MMAWGFDHIYDFTETVIATFFNFKFSTSPWQLVSITVLHQPLSLQPACHPAVGLCEHVSTFSKKCAIKIFHELAHFTTKAATTEYLSSNEELYSPETSKDTHPEHASPKTGPFATVVEWPLAGLWYDHD